MVITRRPCRTAPSARARTEKLWCGGSRPFPPDARGVTRKSHRASGQDRPRSREGSDPDDEHVLRTQSFSRHGLFEIEDALVRLDDGTYGVCEDCRTPIRSGRLETIPYARRCLSCQRTSAK